MSLGVSVLGATGTIGMNTLQVIQRHKNRFHVYALGAHSNVDKMAKLCYEWQPRCAVMADADAAERLRTLLKNINPDIHVLGGNEGLCQIAEAPEAPIVMAAIVGAAGLMPTLAAARAGKRILLANKESLVMTGALFMETVREYGAELLPIDSEHNAIFQCLCGNPPGSVKKIILTASGGPFRTFSPEQLAHVTPAQACHHPNWVMGRKISVDSATMMNKGLEVIEACWLFHSTPDHVDVLIHPQSIIHSLVEYHDGSFLAQLSYPDMRLPIAYGLGWPERLEAGIPSLNLAALARLDFETPLPERFPCLRLAYEAMLAGGTTPAILNAANEVAVMAFLEGRLPFNRISVIIEQTLAALAGRRTTDLNKIIEDDNSARLLSANIIAQQKVY
jgi:1-deoxy-D-xylulose-5-phosphate reductoisomerase